MEKTKESMLEENIERLITASMTAKLSKNKKESVYQMLVLRMSGRSTLIDFPWQAAVGLGMLMMLAGAIVLSRWEGFIPIVHPPAALMLILLGINVLILPAASILIILGRRHAK